MMAYIKHNVNMYLLFLVLFTATSLVGASVFFQHKFDSMVGTYESQINQMNGLSEELNLKQAALQDAQQALDLKQAREDKLNQINEKLASTNIEKSLVEQPKETLARPTGAFTALNTQKPLVVSLATSVGEGFLARPKRNSWALLVMP